MPLLDLPSDAKQAFYPRCGGLFIPRKTFPPLVRGDEPDGSAIRDP